MSLENTKLNWIPIRQQTSISEPSEYELEISDIPQSVPYGTTSVLCQPNKK